MTESFSDKLTRLAREKAEARAAREAYYEAAWRAGYAERRAEDKAAGRDVSGKSVATRRMLAMTDVSMYDPELRRLRDAEDAAEAAYREATGR